MRSSHFLPFALALPLHQTFASEPQQPFQPSENPLQYDPFISSFNTFVSALLHELHTPGMSISVIHGNEVFAKGYGYSDLNASIPATPRTLYHTGSTTKSFTAATMSKLVYSNDSAYSHITWDTKLADLIREDFVLQDPWSTEHLTLTDAMSHRTGMPRHDFSWINGDPSVRKQVRSLRYLPLHREPRVKWEYCNLMFTAVSHAIETVTRTPMKLLLRRWIWKPLGMDETFYTLADALELAETDGDVSMAKGYFYKESEKEFWEMPLGSIPPSNGAGGVISNVLDYTHWIRMFLQPNESTPITRQVLADMTYPNMIEDAHLIAGIRGLPIPLATYGLGLQSYVTYRGHILTGHGGQIGGYTTVMMWIPDSDFGLAIMQNAHSPASSIVMMTLIDNFLDTPKDERTDLVSLAKERENEKKKELVNVRSLLYPHAANGLLISPSLPLEAYEGLYHHPAYQNLTLSLEPSAAFHRTPEPYNFHGASTPGHAALPLYVSPSVTSYLNISGILHHVSGEHWYALMRVGPGSSLDDITFKAQFEVGVEGKVEGLWMGMEPAIEDMIWFGKQS